MNAIMKRHTFKQILDEYPNRVMNHIYSHHLSFGLAISKVLGGKVRKASQTERNIPLWVHLFTQNNDLDDPRVQQGIFHALKNKEENPKNFELTIKLLQSYPNPDLIDRALRTLSKIEVCLMSFWFKDESDTWFKDGFTTASYCYYSNKALAKDLQYRMGLNDGHFTEDHLRKIHTRLGLEKSAYILYTDLDTSGAEPLLIASNKYFD